MVARPRNSRPNRVLATLLNRTRTGLSACLLGIALLAAPAPADAASRIKDIADFEGVRENLLVHFIGWAIVFEIRTRDSDSRSRRKSTSHSSGE